MVRDSLTHRLAVRGIAVRGIAVRGIAVHGIAVHGIVAIAAATVVACASSSSSSGTSAGPAQPATQTIGSAAVGRITIASSASEDVAHLPFAPAAIWRVLPAVYDSIAVPVDRLDDVFRSIGNSGYKTRQRLGKTYLSRYLDCGNTQIGPNADSYDVFLSVLTTVRPEGNGGATLSTIVDAKARPVTFNQAYSRCSSKGSLEQRIAQLVKERLAP